MDLDSFDSTLKNSYERYWETLPEASSDLICVSGANSTQVEGINLFLLLMTLASLFLLIISQEEII